MDKPTRPITHRHASGADVVPAWVWRAVARTLANGNVPLVARLALAHMLRLFRLTKYHR